tara:strand:- start:1902 stop:3293 length:1392 start_codon:yes stop_codon:yes gene_type:complete
MNLSIEKHVFELLKHYDCVIITGLGGFILNPRESYINDITSEIHPPSKTITFNKNLSHNDGLLANYLCEAEGISYNEACVEILKFSRKAKLKLQKGNTILFQNIGTLKYNSTNQLSFAPKTNFNFELHSYGLKSFQINKIKTELPTSKPNMMSAAAVIILLICISIFSLNNLHLDDLMVFNLNPLKTNHYTPRAMLVADDTLGHETPGIYNVNVSKIDPDLYKINGTNYHITTKKCFKEGFGREVQIKIWIDEKERIQREVCFLNIDETEYNDCYRITNVYNEISSHSNKVMVLMKNGRMKEALLVLEETFIDPYIIANSIPEEELIVETNSDSLLIKDLPSRFINAIQSISTPNKEQNPNTDLKNTNTEELNIKSSQESKTISSDKTRKIHIVVGSFSERKNAGALIKQLKNRGFENANIIGENTNGLIRVAVSSFYTEEEARQELINVKLKLSSAWVLNNN